MKALFRKFTRLILSALGVTIVTGCPMVMYGVPHCEYELKGKVVDGVTKESVQGLKVVRTQVSMEGGIPKKDEYQRDSVYTDSEGAFHFQGIDYVFTSDKSHISIVDVDLEQNGLYDSTEMYVDMVKQKKPKSDGWFGGLYKGDVTIEVTQTGKL